MRSQLRPAVVLFLLLTVITGVVYPAVVTVIAKVVFPRQAEGSLILHDGQCIGSELIGQLFTEDRYFWARGSATSPNAFAADAGAGSNLAPSNPALVAAIRQRVEQLRAADPGNSQFVPIGLVTASASGLDPHISPPAAEYQIARVARARKLREDDVRRLVLQFTEGRTFGLLGEPRVNVLKLNLALDGRS